MVILHEWKLTDLLQSDEEDQWTWHEMNWKIEKFILSIQCDAII
jgi:hypothetical protein